MVRQAGVGCTGGVRVFVPEAAGGRTRDNRPNVAEEATPSQGGPTAGIVLLGERSRGRKGAPTGLPLVGAARTRGDPDPHVPFNLVL
eukprot:scaffold31236_cov112-Isochrysis_galbana.AAC.2